MAFKSATTQICLSILTVLRLGAEAGPQDYLQKAKLFLEQGYLGQAEALASEALQDSASEPEALALLGSIRLQQQRYEEGADLLERAIRADGSAVSPRLALGQAYELLGEFQRATELYREALSLAPELPASSLGLVRAETELGNFRQALKHAIPVQDFLRSSPEGLLMLARACAGAGDEQAARGIARDWAALGRLPEEWGLRIARTLSQGGLSEQATAIFEHLKEQGLASFAVAFSLGEIYLRDGNHSKAAENFELAVRFDGRSLAALRQVAGIAERAGDWERALSLLTRARHEAPDDPGLLLAAGRVALQLDRVADAERDLRQALELRPGHSRTRYWLALAFARAGWLGPSLELLEELLAREPDSPSYHLAAGLVQYLRSSPEDASRHLAASLRLEAGQLLPGYYLARIAQESQNHPEAVKLFARTILDHPDHVPSYAGLAVSLSHQGQHEQARLNFEKALALDSRSARANLEFSNHLRRIGRRREAKRRMRAAEALSQRDVERSAIRGLVRESAKLREQ